MPTQKFILYLILTNVLCALCYYILSLFIALSSYTNFFLISLGFFTLYNIFVFIMGRMAIKSKVRNLFVYLVLYNVLIKLLLSFLIVFIYVKQFAPQNKSFLIPFLLAYLVFTVYETYFLNIQAKQV